MSKSSHSSERKSQKRKCSDGSEPLRSKCRGQVAGDESSSVEALLSVPLDFIFRESRPPAAAHSPSKNFVHRGVGFGMVHSLPPPTSDPAPHRRRATLLSRSEAAVLLRVNQLSVELDVLRAIASEAMGRARLCHELRDRIECGPPSSPLTAYLRPLLPLLNVHGSSIPGFAARRVASETGKVLVELGGCASALRQFAEQNWSVSEQLCDAFGYGEVGGALSLSSSAATGLGKEKRAVAEVEESVAARVEGILGMTVSESGHSGETDTARIDDVFDTVALGEAGEFISMRDLCRKLLQNAGCEPQRFSADAKPASCPLGVSNETADNVSGDGSRIVPSDSAPEKLCDPGRSAVDANEMERPNTNGSKVKSVSDKRSCSVQHSAPSESAERKQGHSTSNESFEDIVAKQSLATQVEMHNQQNARGKEEERANSQDAKAALMILAFS